MKKIKNFILSRLIIINFAVVKDFIPRPMGAFNDWQENLVAKVTTFKTGWHWDLDTDSEWLLLTNTVSKKKKRFDAAWAIVKTKSFTHAQEGELIEARKDYESGDKLNATDTSLRMFINRHIRYSSYVTTQQKIDMQLTVPDDVLTPNPTADERSGQTETAGSIKKMAHLMHQSKVTTIDSVSRTKGEGVDAIEVWMVIRAADLEDDPAIKDFISDGEVERGYYLRYFLPEQVGLKAWYIARKRFKGKKKTYGPFSIPWWGLIS